mmetsp:Transcript_8891/g.16044  ORF Transcript_8891/g.16044 Transcript_8891/m.16044 type:complete len:126 (-) Transcript_8891:279-656(-)|eukprot:CAMPEP_0201660744 /NCGR_PEP_ID=MMETSP0494-20130426/3311_1 /ASSEMBLY_ACC=CAM_ASM_000839 /TAXON_ID=420259 /ORGANISM="Thalassiosira gravida, Strain GMp14c1" /LENGTH=125 /DNA_ID=CAMNT_0048138697 /DNA_START=650 /DNA_END=1027 /DNA_ORIENTATION=-
MTTSSFIIYMLFLFLVVSTNVTEDKSHIPIAINAAPKYQIGGTYSPKKIIPYIAEQEKFAAVDKAVPTTLPLSSIPSKKELNIIAFTPIIQSRQIPRVTNETEGHTHIHANTSSSSSNILSLVMQ